MSTGHQGVPPLLISVFVVGEYAKWQCKKERVRRYQDDLDPQINKMQILGRCSNSCGTHSIGFGAPGGQGSPRNLWGNSWVSLGIPWGPLGAQGAPWAPCWGVPLRADCTGQLTEATSYQADFSNSKRVANCSCEEQSTTDTTWRETNSNICIHVRSSHQA